MTTKTNPYGASVIRVRAYVRHRDGRTELVRSHVRQIDVSAMATVSAPNNCNSFTDLSHNCSRNAMSSKSQTEGGPSSSTKADYNTTELSKEPEAAAAEVPAQKSAGSEAKFGPMTEEFRRNLRRLMEGDLYEDQEESSTDHKDPA